MATHAQFHESIQGHNVVAGPQASHGGIIHIHYNQPGAAPVEPPKPFSTVPFPPDDDFIERPDIIQWLDEKSARPAARVALVGLGGVGKSQLAIYFAHRIRERSPDTYVFWVHAGTLARFEESFHYIAERLNLPGRENPNTNVLQLVANWLRNEDNGQWHLIIDNADDADIFSSNNLASYMPQSPNGYVFVTSRSMEIAERLVGSQNIFEVSTMGKYQALRLLRQKLKGDHPQAAEEELVQLLDNIPLAITQAAAFINRRAPRMTIVTYSALGPVHYTYLADLQKNDIKKSSLLNKDSGDLRRDPAALNSIVATWQITFEQIRRERVSAANLLSFMSLFNPQAIPESILKVYSDEEYNDFDEDIEVLRSYALVSTTLSASLFKMHPLVRFCTKVWLLSTGSDAQWMKRFLHIISDCYPSGEYENWTECQELYPHVDELLRKEPKDPKDVQKWVCLLSKVGWYLHAKGNYSKAEQMCRLALTAGDRELGDDDSLVSLCLTVLGTSLDGLGRFSEAEMIHRRALNIRESKLGPSHPGTLVSLSNLALALRKQGKYKEAEVMGQKVIVLSEAELGPDHPNTLLSLNNLAVVLREQGKYKEAEAMNQKALKIREAELGPNHPDTLTSLNNLAIVLEKQGKYKEAEVMGQKVIVRSEAELGPDHPNTLLSLNNLAVVLLLQDKYKEAEEILQRVLKISEAELGSDHPNTLLSLNNLGECFLKQGRYEDAKEIFQKTVRLREAELGPNHPDTLQSVKSLAESLHRLDNNINALQLYKRAHEGFLESYGIDNPNTIQCANWCSVLGERMDDDNTNEVESSMNLLEEDAGQGFQEIEHGNHRRNPLVRMRKMYKSVSIRLKK